MTDGIDPMEINETDAAALDPPAVKPTFVPPTLRKFARYLSGSSRIIGVIGLYSEPNATCIGEGESWAECPEGFGDGADGYCIINGQVVPQPPPLCAADKTAIEADGVDTATISGIPPGAKVTVEDVYGVSRYTVNDGVLQVTADEPGRITVSVDAPPALTYQTVIVAQ